MKLDENIRESFESWFNEHYEIIDLPNIDDEIGFDGIFDLPTSMWFGLFQEFCIANHILIEIGIDYTREYRGDVLFCHTIGILNTMSPTTSDLFRSIDDAIEDGIGEVTNLFLKLKKQHEL